MKIRSGSIICLAFSVLAFSAHGIDLEQCDLIEKLRKYLDYMLGEDPVRYVRYFYVYVICRTLKGKFANQTLPLSPKQFWLYLNGSLVFYDAELASTLPIDENKSKAHGFSLESILDYLYWFYWWAMASHCSLATILISSLPGTALFENYDLYGLVAGILSNDHRTRSIY